MKFAFRDMPDPGARGVRPRPIVDVVVEGMQHAPQACLVDSGATAVRLGLYVAELAGVDLTRAESTEFAAGGTIVRGRLARVSLRISDGTDAHDWEAPVWFCDSWIHSFGLLGLTGFLDQFDVTLRSYQEELEIRPIQQ